MISCTPSIYKETFFEEISLHATEARWYKIFTLAWRGRGMRISLNDVPDQILDKMIEWAEEFIEREPK